MPIEYRRDMPDLSAFCALFETTGWNTRYQASPEELAVALRNSRWLAAAYAGDCLVGFGRVVTDGSLHAMIYDVIVLPEWQQQGIGSQILEMLLERCIAHNIRDVQLFCARGKRDFYEKRGFFARPDEAPGMQYRRSLMRKKH